MIDPENGYSDTLIDFDNAQRSWYLIDLGAFIFSVNQVMYGLIPLQGGNMDAYEHWFNQFKYWLTDSYG